MKEKFTIEEIKAYLYTTNGVADAIVNLTPMNIKKPPLKNQPCSQL